jgi:hypothetical protein
MLQAFAQPTVCSWSLFGCPESCQQPIWMLLMLSFQFLLLALCQDSVNHRILCLRTDNDPFFYLCITDPWNFCCRYRKPSPFPFMALTKFFINRSLLWSGGRTIFCRSTSRSFAKFFFPGRICLLQANLSQHRSTTSCVTVPFTQKVAKFRITKLHAEWKGYDFQIYTNIPTVFIFLSN